MIRLTRFALRYPTIAIVVTLALLVGGAFAALNLNQQLVPDVAFPQATVIAVWPGASADAVTRDIVEPLESALGGITDVDVVEVSARASESFAAVTVRAEYGTSQDALRDAIEAELGGVDLPDDAEDPQVVLFSLSDLPVVQASIRSDSADVDAAALQRLIEDEIVPDLEAVEGVSDVTLVGGRTEKVYLTLDRAKMEAEGVTVDGIRNMLAANDISFPAGTLATDGRSIPLQVSHRIRSEADLRQLALAGGQGGSPGGPPAGMAGGAGGPPAGAAASRAGRTPAATEIVAAADLATAIPPVAGPFPLPAALQALGYQTTDDLTADVILQLDTQNPALLRTVADEVIASLPPGAVLKPDVVAALPNDVRAKLAAHIADGAAAQSATAGAASQPATVAPRVDATAPQATSDASAADQPAGIPPAASSGSTPSTPGPRGSGADTPSPTLRVQVVVVAEGETIDDLAARYGVAANVIREANGLAEDDALVAGSVLRIPQSGDSDRLPAVWQTYGVARAGEITPEILDRALREAPGAVSNLTSEQLLALPPESVRQLPLPFVARQSEAVRQAILDRMSQVSTATPVPTPGGAAAAVAPAAPRLLAPERQSDDAEALTLGDVATIAREPEPARTINRTDGETSLSLLVLKEQSANTVSVVEDVLDEIDTLKDKSALDGVAFNIVFEQASFIKESLSGVRNEGLLGGILAVIIILIFLNFSIRSTLITAVSIPLSIVVALLFMRAQGLTLNLLTLAGLTIAIGRVIDDSIVVIENIYRHVHRGEAGDEAVVAGTAEVATAITAATLVTVAVFLPLGFVGGITSEFFLPFALTATYALLASLFVALTIVPLLARWLLSRAAMAENDANWLERIYTPLLNWSLGHRWATLLLAFAFFGVSLALVRFIDQTFLPSFGEPTIQVEMALPPSAALATTDGVAKLVEAVLDDERDIGAVETTVGRSGQFFGQFSGGDSSRAVFMAKIEDGGGGDDNGDDGDGNGKDEGFLAGFGDEGPDGDAVAERLRDDLAGVRETAVAEGLIGASDTLTLTVSSGAGGGPQSNLYDLQILSDDEAALREANARILRALKDPANWEDLGYDEIPIINLASNLTEARDVLSVNVDPAKALDNGLTTVQVAFALRQALEGQDLGDVELAGMDGIDTLDVVARYPADTLGSVAAVADYALAAPGGGTVRVGEVADVRVQPGPVEITRVDGERAALISGEITTNDTFGVIEAATTIIDDLDLADELGEDVVEVGAGVESRQQQEGFRDMLLALPVSILVVYLIMVVTFGSLVHPFTILFSLPFAVSGALVALAVTGRPISLSSLIGMMMLIGIVTTNAIVLVDLVQQYRERGMGTRAALLAGGRTRVRPIMMTAIATVIALIPLALGFSEGALIASELATTVIGGLVVSTLLTLLVVPVIYSLIEGMDDRGGDASAAPEPTPPMRPTPPPAPPSGPPPAPLPAGPTTVEAHGAPPVAIVPAPASSASASMPASGMVTPTSGMPVPVWAMPWPEPGSTALVSGPPEASAPAAPVPDDATGTGAGTVPQAS